MNRRAKLILLVLDGAIGAKGVEAIKSGNHD